MKIAIIGGAGIQALGTIYDLLESSQVSEVLVADINEVKAIERSKAIGDKRLKPIKIDITDEDNAVKILSDYDAIINCGPATYCPMATRVALKAKKNYVDLGAWPEQTKEQQELHKDFEQNHITAILGMGSAPGISNMMALVGVNQLDTVYNIDIIIAMKDYTKHKSPFVWPYALDTIIDEYTLSPIVVREGQITHLPPLTSEPIDFKEPIGLCFPIYTIHPEPLTLYESFKNKGCKNTSFRIALPKEFHEKMKFLIDLGLGEKKKIQIDGADISPRNVLLKLASMLPPEEVEREQYSVTRVVVTGKKNGQHSKVEVELYVGTEKRWNLPAGALKTSVPPSITAQLFLEGSIKKKGVFPPELAVPPAPFFEALEKRGMEVEWNQTYYAY